MGRRAPVHELRRGRRGRRRRRVHEGLLDHPDGRRPGRRLPRVPVHRRPPARHAARPGRAPRRAHGRRHDVRVRRRPGGVDRGPRARGVRARRRLPRLPHAARALAGRALVHRGRGDEPGPDRAAARSQRERRRRPRLPRTRGPAPGLPPGAPAGAPHRGLPRRLRQARLVRAGGGSRSGRPPRSTRTSRRAGTAARCCSSSATSTTACASSSRRSCSACWGSAR